MERLQVVPEGCGSRLQGRRRLLPWLHLHGKRTATPSPTCVTNALPAPHKPGITLPKPPPTGQGELTLLPKLLQTWKHTPATTAAPQAPDERPTLAPTLPHLPRGWGTQLYAQPLAEWQRATASAWSLVKGPAWRESPGMSMKPPQNPQPPWSPVVARGGHSTPGGALFKIMGGWGHMFCSQNLLEEGGLVLTPMFPNPAGVCRETLVQTCAKLDSPSVPRQDGESPGRGPWEWRRSSWRGAETQEVQRQHGGNEGETAPPQSPPPPPAMPGRASVPPDAGDYHVRHVMCGCAQILGGEPGRGTQRSSSVWLRGRSPQDPTRMWLL